MSDQYRDPLPEPTEPICPACGGPLDELGFLHPKGDQICPACDRICTGSASERMAHKAAVLAAAAEESEAGQSLRDGVEAARLHLETGDE